MDYLIKLDMRNKGTIGLIFGILWIMASVIALSMGIYAVVLAYKIIITFVLLGIFTAIKELNPKFDAWLDKRSLFKKKIKVETKYEL